MSLKPPPPPRDIERHLARLATLAGVLTLFWGCLYAIWGATSDSWPTAAGIVKSAEVGKTQDKGSPFATYRVIVTYEFAVGENRYLGSNVRFAVFERFSGPDADRLINGLKKGRPVKVHYLSFWPHISVLQPGVSAGSVWLPLIGATVTFFGMAVGRKLAPREDELPAADAVVASTPERELVY